MCKGGGLDATNHLWFKNDNPTINNSASDYEKQTIALCNVDLTIVFQLHWIQCGLDSGTFMEYGLKTQTAVWLFM